MYDTIKTSLIGGSGVLTDLVTEAGEAFTDVLPVVIPVVGGIALGFFTIRMVRGLLNI